MCYIVLLEISHNHSNAVQEAVSSQSLSVFQEKRLSNSLKVSQWEEVSITFLLYTTKCNTMSASEDRQTKVSDPCSYDTKHRDYKDTHRVLVIG